MNNSMNNTVSNTNTSNPGINTGTPNGSSSFTTSFMMYLNVTIELFSLQVVGSIVSLSGTKTWTSSPSKMSNLVIVPPNNAKFPISS